MLIKFINASWILIKLVLFLPLLIILGFILGFIWLILAPIYVMITKGTIKDFWYETRGEEIEILLKEAKYELLFWKS